MTWPSGEALPPDRRLPRKPASPAAAEVLARSAATIAQAEGGDSFSRSVVAVLFGLPGGPFLVGLVGVALDAAGG